MSEYTHQCIKCGESYKDNDVDAYYCSPCNEVRKEIAQKIDKQTAMKPKRQVKSDFQLYDEMCKMRRTAFVPIKDLGIKL